MKKKLSIALCIIMALLFIMGCSSGSSSRIPSWLADKTWSGTLTDSDGYDIDWTIFTTTNDLFMAPKNEAPSATAFISQMEEIGVGYDITSNDSYFAINIPNYKVETSENGITLKTDGTMELQIRKISDIQIYLEISASLNMAITGDPELGDYTTSLSTLIKGNLYRE